MDKKDIYEHLADIYLSASSKRKKKNKKYSQLFRNLFLGSLAVIILLSVTLSARTIRNKPINSEIALFLSPDVVKINFNFDPAKKETFSMNLNNLNLQHFTALAFSLKKANPGDNIKLRVEFINRFKEKSEIYLGAITPQWQDLKIALNDFKNIHDWSEMTNLAFIVEEWNTKEKSGIIYLDNIRFLK